MSEYENTIVLSSDDESPPKKVINFPNVLKFLYFDSKLIINAAN